MKFPQVTTQNLVFNLQNKLYRYSEFLFRVSAATQIEKEKRKGVGRNEVLYIAIYVDISICLSS